MSNTEALVRLSRRTLWCTLLLIVILGCAGIFFVGLGEDVRKVMLLMPMMIPLALAASRSGWKGLRADPAMQAVHDDELRQAAIALGWRNGFFALLVLQPVLGVVIATLPVAHPAALMTCASALVGAVVFLSTLLYCDRA